MRFYLILGFVTMLFSSSSAINADGGRALKILEKGEYDKLILYLDRSIEKDSINPGARYVYSRLYLDSGFHRFNIDTSYFYINAAIEDFEYVDERDAGKLDKDGINDSTMLVQKQKVEMTSFIRAKREHTIDSYDYFIDHFSSAGELDSAIYYRNELAYQFAREINTYESFREFMRTYPEAIQITEATQNYERLLFQTMTKDGELETYIRFLRNNPQTPYRTNTEKSILELVAADNQPENYEWFIKEYPKSKIAGFAKNLLYHRYKDEFSGREALNRYSFLRNNDSLKNIVHLDTATIFPVYENGKYAFFTQTGDRIIDFLYDSISEKLLCGNIQNDFLEVHNHDHPAIVARNGFTIFDHPYHSVSDLGSGFLKIEKLSKSGVVHKTGAEIFDFVYDDIQFIGNEFFKVKEGENWGLYTVLGREILPVEYDEITSENAFIIVKQGDFYAISNFKTLKNAPQQDYTFLDFLYDDYFLIDDLHLVAIRDENEALIDENLKIITDLADHQINNFFDGWVEKTEKGYRIYDKIFHPFSSEYYSQVLIDSKKIAYEMWGIWGVYFQGKDFQLELKYDSVQFLSDDIALLIREDSLFAAFQSDTTQYLQDYQEVKLLRPQVGISNTSEIPSYLLVKNKRGVTSIYDQQGELIIRDAYDDVEAIGREYLVVTKNQKKGLFSSTGQELLNIKYQALSNYDKGYLSTMLNNKFGIFHFNDVLLLSAKHEKTLKPYGKEYFVSEDDGQLAFVNKENDFVTEFEFYRIQHWNDTTALVKLADKWQLFDIKNKAVLYDDIELAENIVQNENEKIIRITKEGQVGLLGSVDGEIVGPTFNDIYNVGSNENPLFFAEKYIPEAEFFIIIYYRKNGDIVRKQVFDEEEYWKIYCNE